MEIKPNQEETCLSITPHMCAEFDNLYNSFICLIYFFFFPSDPKLLRTISR